MGFAEQGLDDGCVLHRPKTDCFVVRVDEQGDSDFDAAVRRIAIEESRCAASTSPTPAS
jgi:hypothetical protein